MCSQLTLILTVLQTNIYQSTGTSPQKQIVSIFEIMGAPNDVSWPSIKFDPEFRSLNIPKYPGRDLKSLVPRLGDSGIDLLKKFLECNPLFRVSADKAMLHHYFCDLPGEIHSLADCESIFSIPSIKLSKELSKREQLDLDV